MKSFEHWEYEEIQLSFGLERVKNSSALESWLAATCQVSLEEQKKLDELRNLLFDYADAWNEDELKFFFISPLVNLVNFRGETYQPFTQRKLTAKLGNIEVGGVVDFLVATGIQHPRQPFFCLHEYKQERKRENDPLGQLLIAMLVAQAKNEQPRPIYGSYINGRFWFFVLLHERDYMVSNAYNASKADELGQIFAILRQVKTYIQAL